MKTMIIFVIITISVIAGIFLIVINLGITPQDQSLTSRNYIYEIQGDAGGAGSHTKTDLLLKRSNNDDQSDIHFIDITKDLHYTDNIMFWDWQIHTFENYVFVSWITSEQSWSDVFLAISDDYGKTFDVKNISQSKEYVHQYKIDYSEETVYVVWEHEFITEENFHFGQIYFTKSDDFGNSFGQQKLLSTFDKPSQEPELEAFGDDVFIAWQQETDLQDGNNIWFATSTDRGDYFDRKAKLSGAHIDAESSNDILHLTWVSIDDNDQIWYAYSEDLGQTLLSKVIFDADWKLSPYADRPIPKLTIDDKIAVNFEMNNEEGENTPYIIGVNNEN